MLGRRSNQLSFLDMERESRVPANHFLRRLDEYIDWKPIERELEKLYGSRFGRPSHPPLLMFKSLLLQQWYGLSDAGLEESLRDRLSFQGFVGLGLDKPVPDETTFVVFRKRLIAANLGKKLFELVNAQLDARKLFVRKGALIDATIVDAAVKKPRFPKSRKGDGAPESDQAATVGEDLAGETNQDASSIPEASEGKMPPSPSLDAGTPEAPADARETDATSASSQSVDPDATWTYKHGTWSYGFKIHCCVDEGQLLIRTIDLTTASTHDSRCLRGLMPLDVQAVYGDKAYDCQQMRNWYEKQDIACRILHKAARNRPLSDDQKALNKLWSRTRSEVERVFGIFKHAFGLSRMPYRGKARNALKTFCLGMAFNLRRAVTLLDA